MRIRYLCWGLLGLSLAFTAPPAFAQSAWNSVTLTWTTPGDDGTVGTASQFDLRYSTSPITAANFASASRFLATPTPLTSGSTQNVTVTGLSPSTLYYFAIKTGDEVPNWASISNITQRTTSAAPDNARPAPLAISVGTLTDTTAALQWVATGDDSLTGTAASYDVRYSTTPITEANWAAATQSTGEPVPGAPGTSQSHVVRNLGRQVTYYFAVKLTDESGNVSAISNVPSATTLDTMPPAAITNLSASLVLITWHSGHAARPRDLETRTR